MSEDIWGWKFTCEVCGNTFRSTHHTARYCKSCSCMSKSSITKKIIGKWINASMCITCGEINPLLLCSKDGHHVIGRGRNKNDINVTICANCHELTKPRQYQGFFLFTNRKFPIRTKFTMDNSPIYICL